jgi:predicted ATPase/class 3 adenylate cyclase
MEQLPAYLPADRLRALASEQPLAERVRGTALFADIAGFTPLTEALLLALGPQRGTEELPRQLNQVYDALIAEVHRYGGSVIGFAGDAITCWFDESSEPSGVETFEHPNAPALQHVDVSQQAGAMLSRSALAASACALAMQQAMQPFATIAIAGAGTVRLAVKIAVAAGTLRRFVVGDPGIQLVDTLAGAALDRLATGEHLAQRGEIMLDEAAAAALSEQAHISGWREDHESNARYAVLIGLTGSVAPSRIPLPSAVDEDNLKPWLLPPVYARLRAGLGGFLTELRPATALFLSFGGLDFDDDDLAPRKLDAFVRWVQRVLQRYDAWMLQLTIGDKGCYLYAVFGAPVAHEDDPVRACLAALELREPQLDFISDVRIGISQGRMRTGAYGALDRRTYGALGDEVNMAARLMQHAPLGGVLVSEAARRLTADAFAWELLPPLRVKGKAQPLPVARLIGREERRSIRLHEPRYSLPMLGRAVELTMIGEWLERARSGYGRIVAIIAEAGIGKSRLVAELIRLAQRQGVTVYGGECQSHGVSTSYLVWRAIWRGFFDLDPGQAADAQIAALHTALARLDANLLPRLPLLGTVLNFDIPDNELTERFEPKLRKTALEALLLDCLRARARKGPLLIVLEDIHWIDALSDDLLLTIGRAVADLPIMLVVAYRPPSQGQPTLRIAQLGHFNTVPLSSLPDEAVAALVQLKLQQLFGTSEKASAALIARINQQAQGNPFFVEELLNYLRDRGIDPNAPEQFAHLDLPDTLHSLVLSRIDQLNDQQRSLLKAASVIGRFFRTSLLFGLDIFAARQAVLHTELDALSEMDLTPLDSPYPELTYLFKHVVTQEVAYESLPFVTRAVLHGEIGALIEQFYPQDRERMLDLLAYHYDRSDDLSKRREYLLRAATAAQRDYANAAAIDYYQRVLPLLDASERGEVLLALGKVLELTGAWEEADKRYHQALALAADRDTAAAARGEVAIADLLRRRGNYVEAARWAERARNGFAQANDRRGLAQTLNIAGIIADLQGDYESAEAHYQASLTAWRALGDQAQTANVLSNIGAIASSRADHGQALVLQQEALELRRAVGDRWRIAYSLNYLGNIANDTQQHELARAQLEESLALMRQVGDSWMIGNILNNLGNALRDAGSYAEAGARYRESINIYCAFGDRWALAYLFEDVGILAALDGNGERALRLVGAGSALRDAIGAPRSTAEQARLDQVLAPARQLLDAAAQQAAIALGQSLALEHAIAYALDEG